MIESAKRKPDYFGDIKKYGEFGEQVFLDKYSADMEIVDVRKNPAYQKMDIDFLIAGQGKRFVGIDVKVDTTAIETGNLVYEVVSHARNGWAVTTKAKYIFVVMAREQEELTAVRGFWLDMDAWREYCSRRDTAKEVKILGDEKIVNLLCPIYDLRNEKVIVKEVSF